jgi:DMSO reductase anchor subunit
LLLFLLLMLPYNLFLWLDRNAGVDGKGKQKEQAQPSRLRLLRLISGALTVLAGLTTLFVIAMIYRPLAAANLGGVFTIASFFAAALALGGVMTAMWLGHWYLVTPALSEKPLQFATTLVLLGVLAQVIFAITAGPSTTYPNTAPTSTPTITATPTTAVTPPANAQTRPAGVPVVAPLSTDAIGWLRILISFVLPLALGGLAWKLIRDRSFQSATGMLYLVVVCTIAGEVIARGLFLRGL